MVPNKAKTSDDPDPRQAQLQIGNVYDVTEVRRAVRELEDVREDVIKRLHDVPCRLLAATADGWDWSAVQHLRHLVFAEELYTNRWILQNDEPFSGLGLLPDWLEGKPGYEAVGTEPTQDLEAVVSAWQKVHARTQHVLATLTEQMLRTSTKGRDFGQGDVGRVFRTLTSHDLHHIRAAEGVLADLNRS